MLPAFFVSMFWFMATDGKQKKSINSSLCRVLPFVGLSGYLLPSLSHFFQHHSILFRLGQLGQTVALHGKLKVSNGRFHVRNATREARVEPSSDHNINHIR